MSKVIYGIENEYEVDDYVREDLEAIFENALGENGAEDIVYLRTLWDGESWASIKDKWLSEGSIWIVWYYDGIREHYENLEEKGDIVRLPSTVASMLLSPTLPLLFV